MHTSLISPCVSYFTHVYSRCKGSVLKLAGLIQLHEAYRTYEPTTQRTSKRLCSSNASLALSLIRNRCVLLWEAKMADRSGQQLGNYRLLRLLGRGGFAEVYLGQHLYLNSLAALKVLHIVLTDEDIERFAKEARTLASLNHPHI